MDQNKIWGAAGLNSRLLVYLNDLSKNVEHKALPILFADDTSILLTSPDLFPVAESSQYSF